MLCPITSRQKGYPFEVALSHGSPVAGVILADQLRSVDWKVRNAEFIGAVSEEVSSEGHF